MTVELNKQLNLVIQVGSKGWVHASPIRYEIFDKYLIPISKTFNFMFLEVGGMAAPRVSYMLLKKLCVQDGTWEGPEGVENGLINEMIRLSNAVLPAKDKGWQTIPLYEAIRQEKFDAQEVAEVLGQLVFFIVNSAMQKRESLPAVLYLMTGYYGGLITSQTLSEYIESLKQSTKEETSDSKETPSSTKSSTGPVTKAS